MQTTLATAVLLTGALFTRFTGIAGAQGQTSRSHQSPAELAERTLRRRAVEAVIWGMPAVNYDLMLREMLGKTAGKVGQVIYWGRPLDWHNQTLTPNPDALYFMTFFNTKDGPIVLDLPPGDKNGSFNGNIVTVWQMPLEDAGLLGVDKGKGGKFLILPRATRARRPRDTSRGNPTCSAAMLLIRSNLASHSDAGVAKSIAYGKKVKVYPLAQAANPPATVFTDVKDVDFDSTIRYDASFFEHLDRIVQEEPWLQRDRAMIDQLKSLGIDKREEKLVVPLGPFPACRVSSPMSRGNGLTGGTACAVQELEPRHGVEHFASEGGMPCEAPSPGSYCAARCWSPDRPSCGLSPDRRTSAR